MKELDTFNVIRGELELLKINFLNGSYEDMKHEGNTHFTVDIDRIKDKVNNIERMLNGTK